ncbi:penicillin-binding transpeptidase domain-containing protein [Streptomyces sp. NPDC051219]|uniref:penicillin-binding transpeptidase domain-containing protein n=1 Tax=Streptomyces sp. NPDC051219 TaxID=3155283 RepID=UPI00344495CB
MRSGTKVAVVGGVFVVLASGAGYGAYNVLGGTSGVGGAVPVRTGPPSAEEIDRTAKDFLAAWAEGDVNTASGLTNNAAEAQPALATYRTDAHVSQVALTPGTPVGATVPFTVKAVVSYEGRTKPWTYESALTVVRGVKTGKPLVDWVPTVVHPKLTTGLQMKTGTASAPSLEAVDRDGKPLTREKYPSLGPVLDQLRTRYGELAGGGEPGVELWIDSVGEGSPDQTLLTLSEGKPAKLETTLDAGVQEAAERAVKKYGESSVVAIEPSTGHVLGFANHRADGYNAAFQGQLAPGSTMKIVTAALYLDKGLMSYGGSAPCPKSAVWYGQTFRNLKGFEIPDATFEQSFARSCNTAFIKPIADDAIDDASLTDAADRFFGLGHEWSVGIPSFDGSVPVTGKQDSAAAMIGQGKVLMSPLNMASVTATVKTGRFDQPVIVAQSLDNRQLATADGLKGSVARALRRAMQLTAASGTGAGPMAGVPSPKGAKTGSAEIDGNAQPNSWFTGYSGDLAAAAVVEKGGHGGDAAGPIVAAVLRAGN